MTERSLRFYPESVPPFPNEATQDRFSIIKFENGCGEGIISLKAFFPGQVVFSFRGEYHNEITLYTLQVRPGLHIHDPYVMGKVLHSCDPNTDCDMSTLTFTARKVIKPGDIISMDYDQTEEVLFRPFACACGAPNCRGFIQGSKGRTDEDFAAKFVEAQEVKRQNFRKAAGRRQR
jgi:tyrocidine synthetase-3